MITLCDLCNHKCFSEVKKNCLTKNWMDFEPEAEYICRDCRAWKGGQCRLTDGLQCIKLGTIIYTLVAAFALIDDIEESEVISKLKGI